MNVQKPPRDNDYRLVVEPVCDTAIARHGDTVLAASDAARIMYETRLNPVVYFPLEDVKVELQESSEHKTFCPFKGTATYWHVLIDGKVFENGAWCYQHALPESKDIEGLVSFSSNVLSAVDLPKQDDAPESSGHVSGPMVNWILREAWLNQTAEELTGAIGRKMLENGVAISRISIMIWSLHPMIAGKNYVWTKEDDQVQSYTASYDILDRPSFANSPIRHVANGLGGVRQSLLTDHAEFPFPIMEDLKSKGATDYVAMPLHFSNGLINVMTLTSDHPDGFTTANLGLIFECSPVMGRLYEVFALRENASALLETYLGKRTGARVLGGEIRRGDGDRIDAAILFCDLRNSSLLAESMDRDSYLVLLNDFFETTTQIVNAHDGEVLKFIGDAVLAIFPAGEDSKKSCTQALSPPAKLHKR